MTTSPWTESEPLACVLTPELTAGPYYLDGPLARPDITEGRPGSRLEFQVRVLALPGCGPLVGAAVDVWHCDAGGEYSGWNGSSLAETNAEGRNDDRYLRGVQLTDIDGVATFTTIFPGWYEGRTVHIHLKVLEGGTLAETYTGGHVAHVGQAFFDEAATAALLRQDPYRAHTGQRTTNAQDSIYAQAGPGAIAPLVPGSDDARDGSTARFTCLVDPAATPPPAPLF
jgi:protocatechuate 3,4-dioxygenase beta subunit